MRLNRQFVRMCDRSQMSVNKQDLTGLPSAHAQKIISIIESAYGILFNRDIMNMSELFVYLCKN